MGQFPTTLERPPGRGGDTSETAILGPVERAALAHRDVELGVLYRELDDDSVASEIRGFEVPEVNVRIACVILALTVLAQRARHRGRVRHQAAVELPPLDENGLVEVVV